MKKLNPESAVAFLKLIIAIILASCSHSAHERSTIPLHLRNKYRLVWNDEFDGTSIDTAKWNFRAEGTLRNFATVSRKTITVDGKGNALIMVTADSSGNYFVGQLGTMNIFETRFGYFECRAKMNKSIGPHVAFWLQSEDIGKTGNPCVNGTEIDIFEYHRKDPGAVYHNLHWDGYGSEHKTTGIRVPFPGIEKDYHTFGLEWNEKEYVFYIDGKETWRTDTALSCREQYLILSTELTGFGGEPRPEYYPDTVVFDYVRVYKPNY